MGSLPLSGQQDDLIVLFTEDSLPDPRRRKDLASPMRTAVKGRAGNIGPDLELCMADIWNVGSNEQNKLCSLHLLFGQHVVDAQPRTFLHLKIGCGIGQENQRNGTREKEEARSGQWKENGTGAKVMTNTANAIHPTIVRFRPNGT